MRYRSSIIYNYMRHIQQPGQHSSLVYSYIAFFVGIEIVWRLGLSGNDWLWGIVREERMLQELLWQVASGEIDIVDRILAQLYQGVEMSWRWWSVDRIAKVSRVFGSFKFPRYLLQGNVTRFRENDSDALVGW